MNIEQLRSLLEIAETGSFRRAAERLGMTQPTISARIKSLEDLLGQRLVNRAKNGVTLTEAGHRFRRYAEIAVQSMATAKAQAQLLPGISHVAAVGLHNYFGQDFLSDHLAQLSKNLPYTAFRFELDYSEPLLRQVAAGLLDIGAIYIPRVTTDLEIDHVADQGIKLIATPGLDYPSASFIEHYIQVYWGEDFLGVQSEALGQETTPRLSVSSPALATALLRKGEGAAYLDPVPLASDLENGALVILSEAPIYRRRIYLARRPNAMSPEIEVIAESIRSHFLSLGAN